MNAANSLKEHVRVCEECGNPVSVKTEIRVVCAPEHGMPVHLFCSDPPYRCLSLWSRRLRAVVSMPTRTVRGGVEK